jgi:hypothetical protein
MGSPGVFVGALKISFRSDKSWIRSAGRCSSNVRAKSATGSGKLRMIKSSLSAPPQQASRKSSSHRLGFVSRCTL